MSPSHPLRKRNRLSESGQALIRCISITLINSGLVRLKDGASSEELTKPVDTYVVLSRPSSGCVNGSQQLDILTDYDTVSPTTSVVTKLSQRVQQRALS